MKKALQKNVPAKALVQKNPEILGQVRISVSGKRGALVGATLDHNSRVAVQIAPFMGKNTEKPFSIKKSFTICLDPSVDVLIRGDSAYINAL